MNDQFQQPPPPPPVQIQMQPQPAHGFDVYALLMQAHTSSLQNAADMRNHLKECNDRDRRNETMFNETKSTTVKLFERMETHKTALETSLTKMSNEVNSSNKWIYMIVGGITVIGVLADKVNFAGLFSSTLSATGHG